MIYKHTIIGTRVHSPINSGLIQHGSYLCVHFTVHSHITSAWVHLDKLTVVVLAVVGTVKFSGLLLDTLKLSGLLNY
jgi:hypothetical protein